MNKIPLSLWKQIARVPKNRNQWQKCKELGKDPGPEDPSWVQQVTWTREESHGFFYHERYSRKEQGQPDLDMLFDVAWSKQTGLLYRASVTFDHGNRCIFMMNFRFMSIKVLECGPEILRTMALCRSVHICYSEGAVRTRLQDQGCVQLGGFQDHELEKIIRIYRACSPLTLWLVEDMAKTLSSSRPRESEDPVQCGG